VASRKYYGKYVQAGVCAQAPSHGSATHGVLCEVCHAKNLDATKRLRRRNAEKGLCPYGASHGPVADGKRACEACLKYFCREVTYQRKWNRENGYCPRGTSHGLVAPGTLCEKCRAHERAKYAKRKAEAFSSRVLAGVA
jgi:hypothetical protein